MRNLVKTPLTAVIFAALMHFAVGILPYSQGYTEALAQRIISPVAYGFLIVYGLCVSAAVALALGFSRYQGLRAAWPVAVALLGTVGVLPRLKQLVLGDTTGVMTRADLLLQMIAVIICCALFLVLGMFFFKPQDLTPITPRDTMLELKRKYPDNKISKQMVQEAMQKAAIQAKKNSKAIKAARAKYKYNLPGLLVRLLLLPLLYCVLAFLAWYFLAWRVQAVRSFYGGPEEYWGPLKVLIDLLLNNAKVLPIALISGLLYALCLVPLLGPLAGRRLIYVVTSVLFCLSGALRMLFPDAVLPDEVRIARMLEHVVLLALYGGATGILLHTSLRRIVPERRARRRPNPAADAQAKDGESRDASKQESKTAQPVGAR